MLSMLPARPGRRARRVLLAAALPAALAVTALPAAADAAIVDVGRSSFLYGADPGEINDVRITEAADGSVTISDTAPIRVEEGTSVCQLDAAGDAVCGVGAFSVSLGDRNDTIRYLARAGARLQGGDGNDAFFAGERRDPIRTLIVEGGPGTADKVSYANADFPVNVSIDGQANDGGRSDIANVGTDVEVVEGSPFGDRIAGSDADERERFIGGLGNDVIDGLGGGDVFHEGPASSGSDDLEGGAGIDLVDYSQRTRGVLVDHDLAFDDGAPGENDRVDPNTNDIFGSQAADIIGGQLRGQHGPRLRWRRHDQRRRRQRRPRRRHGRRHPARRGRRRHARHRRQHARRDALRQRHRHAQPRPAGHRRDRLRDRQQRRHARARPDSARRRGGGNRATTAQLDAP